MSAIRKALGLDEVASFEARFAAVDADSVAALAEKSRAEAALHEAEKSGDTKTADSAASALAVVDGKLVRLHARREAVIEGLTEARAAKAAQEKSVRVAGLKSRQAKAASAADTAQAEAVSLISALGAVLVAYFEAARIESDCTSHLGVEAGEGFVPHVGIRGLSAIEEAARIRGQYVERLQLLIPLPIE